MPRMSAQDLEWQTRRDADTLAEYQAIMEDKARMNRARKQAMRQAEDLTKRASAMSRAANVGRRKK